MKLSRDNNGNKLLKIESSDLGGCRGFSIQTLGNLPKVHCMTKETFNTHEALNDLHAYVKLYGTTRQKDLLGW